MPQHTRGASIRTGPYVQPHYGQPDTRRECPSYQKLARECGEVVYFIRCTDGLIKIGYTDGHLDQRKQVRKVDWAALVAIVPGTRQTESGYHAQFKAHLARGREWFYPVQEILDVVNEIRGSMGLSLLASF